MASSFLARLIYKTNLLEITGINCFRCGNGGVPILPWASRTSTMINHPLTILRRSAAAAAKPGLVHPKPRVPGGGAVRQVRRSPPVLRPDQIREESRRAGVSLRQKLGCLRRYTWILSGYFPSCTSWKTPTITFEQRKMAEKETQRLCRACYFLFGAQSAPAGCLRRCNQKNYQNIKDG